MDSMTDVVDRLVDDLVANKLVHDDDRVKAFLTIEDSLQTIRADFNVRILFNGE